MLCEPRFWRFHNRQHCRPSVCFPEGVSLPLWALSIRGSTRKWSRFWLDFRGLGEFEGIFYVNAEIPECVLDFGVAQQKQRGGYLSFCK